MPPRGQPVPLSVDDLARVRAALEQGKRPTVYLRDAVPSLGVEAASSAKVVSVNGETVTVRPKGVGDEVPYEAGELYATRAAASAAASTPAPPRSVVRAARPARPTPRRRKAIPPANMAAEKPQEPPPPVTVTLSGSADGGWTVHCARGTRAGGPATPVAAEAVSRAVAALGEKSVSAAVADVLEHARRSAARRVADLSDQLENAQRALDALSQPQS